MHVGRISGGTRCRRDGTILFEQVVCTLLKNASGKKYYTANGMGEVLVRGIIDTVLQEVNVPMAGLFFIGSF